MAKEAKKEAAKADPKAAETKAVAKPKVIKKITNPDLSVEGVSLVPFNPKSVQVFGNNFMLALVAQVGLETEATKALADANHLKTFLSFEMTKAVFSLAMKTKGQKNEIDLYAVFSTETKDVQKLNNRVLQEMGVMKREVQDDDRVVYIWTDKKVQELYDYTGDLKEKDEPEYQKRFNNRKRLNQRLADAYKAASTLMDHKLSPEDLYYSEDESGTLVPTIQNAPKQIAGDTEKGIVQLNQRKPVKGANLSPTISSLIKISTERHKEPSAPRQDKDEKREEEKMGMTDEAFGSIVNSLRRAIQKQENVFTPEMQKQIAALKPLIDETVAGFLIKKPVEEVAAEAVA
jgi:hypothetical protein